MSRNSINLSAIRHLHEFGPPERRHWRPIRFRLAQAFLGQVTNDLIIVWFNEPGTSIDIHGAEAINGLCAQAEDRQITLKEGLLISCELHPFASKGINN